MVFCKVRNAFTARSSCASSTSRMSDTSARTIGKVNAPTFFTAMPSASVGPPHGRLSAFQRVEHRGIERALDADDLDGGPDAACRNRVAGDQPAAADRHHQHVEVRRILQHLERDGPLPGDDMRIVIRVHPDERTLGGERLGTHLRVGDGFAMQHNSRAIGFGRGDLHERRRDRHHDRRRNAKPARVIGDRLRVIAGRHRDDAARAFGRAQASRALRPRRAP